MPSPQLATLIGTDAYWVQVSLPVDQLGFLELPSKGREGSSARVSMKIEEVQIGFIEQGCSLYVPVRRGNLRDKESHRHQRCWIVYQNLFLHLSDIVNNAIADHLSLLSWVAHVVGACRCFDNTTGQ